MHAEQSKEFIQTLTQIEFIHFYYKKNKHTTVQSYKEIHVLERGLEEGNVVSMVVGVPSHLWGE